MSVMTDRQNALMEAADSRVLVIDGAMGTALQNLQLVPEDFGGPDLEGCNENLNLTRPDVILQVHRDYLKSGCDIVETNSFGSTPLVLDEYGLGAKAYEISKLSAEIARRACEEFSTPDRLRFVAGSVGPTTKALSVTGGVSFDDLEANFLEQMRGLIDGGADYLLIETAQDARNIKAALRAVEKLEQRTRQKLLVAISGTVETMGTMLAGQTVEALLASVMHRDLFYIGLNCATGPSFMTDHVRSLAQLSPFRVACVPNAGLPDEEGCYLETPQMMTEVLRHFLKESWLNFVGGCCGTHAGHIHSFAELAKGFKPRSIPSQERAYLSGIDFLEVTDDLRPLIVGERTNVIGSKKFKTLISEGRYEEAAEIARAQVKSGAHIVDVCLSNPDRNELLDMTRFMEKAIQLVKVPWMIDSTDEKVIEEALKFCQGKAIINSINLEDGEERFEKIVPLAKSYGAAVVVGTIDEDPEHGMAVSRERKLAIAERSFELLVNKYGMRASDLYFDPLVFPCATGDEKYVGSAVETIEGVGLIKKRFPLCKTVLGVSNVSFGLPAAGREVLNSVFLHHCVQAGLDLAIVNSEKLERFASLDPEAIELANNLLWNRGEDPIGRFATRFREKVQKSKLDRTQVPLEERLSRMVVEGTKEGLIEDLTEALTKSAPLVIINGPLMKGMDEVGRLFNDNKLIVAEVLQSAEVMKAAVSHLEQFMEKSESSNRGRMLLATVKGDVHDIGKNLVDIILSNNGYEVINLGIKIPPEKLIEETKKHRPDMIGLSGLLVKSAQQMALTAEDLQRAGIQTPILVGGAALTKNFTEKRILPAYGGGMVLYAKDAMNGLDLAHKLMDPRSREELMREQRLTLERVQSAQGQSQALLNTEKIGSAQLGTSSISRVENIPGPPDLNRHVIRQVPLEQIFKFINPLMLYNRHLGVKGRTAKILLQESSNAKILERLRQEDPAGAEIFQVVEMVKRFVQEEGLLAPAAVYQYFRAQGAPNTISLLSADAKVLETFEFPRMTQAPWLSLCDYVHPDANIRDHVILFVTTAGARVREQAEIWKQQGQYLKSHVLQALAIETAEAFAESLHSLLRSQWGFPDPLEMSMMERFQAKYRGKRYSFGYPACPRLEDQEKLFRLLRPQDIGVHLTESFMMDPEASVSAMVFHHPQATYFSVGNPLQESSEEMNQ
ncbi:MAG: methionine synthase [Bdellovibrio sp.]